MTNPTGGNKPVPRNTEEALEIGRTRFPQVWPNGTPVTLHVHEFDIGYLVYASIPQPADPTLPPEPGGSNIVVSKINGDITDVPNYPAEQAIEVYRRYYRPSA